VPPQEVSYRVGKPVGGVKNAGGKGSGPTSGFDEKRRLSELEVPVPPRPGAEKRREERIMRHKKSRGERWKEVPQ